MKNIISIQNREEYETALKRIDEIITLNPKKGTVVYDELDVLGILVSAYEDLHYPVDAPAADE